MRLGYLPFFSRSLRLLLRERFAFRGLPSTRLRFSAQFSRFFAPALEPLLASLYRCYEEKRKDDGKHGP